MTTTRETADHAELARLAEAASETLTGSGWFFLGNDVGSRFINAMSPAVCSALLSEIAALRGERDRLAEELHNEIMVCAGKSFDADVAERQRDELRKALDRQCDNMSFVLNRVDLHAWADKFSREVAEDRALLANQGADQ